MIARHMTGVGFSKLGLSNVPRRRREEEEEEEGSELVMYDLIILCCY